MKSLPRPVIRRATRADLEKFYRTKTIRQTLSARIATVNNRMVGCGGVAWIDGRVFVFLDLKPSARRYKLALVKAAKEVVDEVRADGCRVMYAQRDPTEPTADKWLRRLGFEPTLKPGIYRWQVLAQSQQ